MEQNLVNTSGVTTGWLLLPLVSAVPCYYCKEETLAWDPHKQSLLHFKIYDKHLPFLLKQYLTGLSYKPFICLLIYSLIPDLACTENSLSFHHLVISYWFQSECIAAKHHYMRLSKLKDFYQNIWLELECNSVRNLM